MTFRKINNTLNILALSLCILFTGCHKDNKTHIKFSTWGSETEINILKPLLKDFEKENPDIKVDLIHIPQNYFQKLHMLVAANLAPDVMFINNFNLPVYESGNVLSDLNDNLNASKKISKDAFFKNSLETMSCKKKLLAIPRDISNVVIYYNKDLFKKYGVTKPYRNWTYKDLISAGKKLTIDTNKDNQPDIYGISFEALPIYYLPFAWSNGGNLVNKEGNEFTLYQNPGCSGLQKYADLRNKYHIAPTASESGNNTMAQLFIQGKLAMYISGRWNIPKFREDIPFNWDVINFPTGKKGSIVGLDGSGWSVYSKSTHKKEAWKLIEYLASARSINKLTATGLIVPARIDIASGKSFLGKGLPPENPEIFLEIIKTSQNTPKLTRWNEVTDTINTAMEPVWNGNASACTALTTIKDEINELLQ